MKSHWTRGRWPWKHGTYYESLVGGWVIVLVMIIVAVILWAINVSEPVDFIEALEEVAS